ncbi:MAG TPA: hypothetical protein VFK69_06355 [Candidatus Eisenbacteria bacterium]|nr:hypothetical protein [Candidatus Eisenbacteria bacterium]
MIRPARGVGLAVFALLSLAPVARAADDTSAPADTLKAAKPNYYAGKGGVGGGAGPSYFRFDRALGKGWFGDYSEGSQGRLAFVGQFRYVVSPRWRWQVSPGFSWTAYRDARMPMRDPSFPSDSVKSAVITLVAPVTGQIQYTRASGWWLYHAGVGPGLYRVWVENHRKVLKDPVSFELHRRIVPGAVFELGAERFIRGISDMCVEFSLANHLVFAKDTDHFPSGFNSNLMDTELRVGVSYYFDLVRVRPGLGPGGPPPGAR